MRRKNMGGKMVKKCIIWAMSFVMVATPIMSSEYMLTAYAHENIEETSEKDKTEETAVEETVEQTEVTVEQVETELEQVEEVAEITSDLAFAAEDAVADVETVLEPEAAVEQAEELIGAEAD